MFNRWHLKVKFIKDLGRLQCISDMSKLMALSHRSASRIKEKRYNIFDFFLFIYFLGILAAKMCRLVQDIGSWIKRHNIWDQSSGLLEKTSIKKIELNWQQKRWWSIFQPFFIPPKMRCYSWFNQTDGMRTYELKQLSEVNNAAVKFLDVLKW